MVKSDGRLDLIAALPAGSAAAVAFLAALFEQRCVGEAEPVVSGVSWSGQGLYITAV